jgi:hypothetical protein
VAAAAAVFVYTCLARPGVLSGYVDFFIFSNLQKLTQRKFRVSDFEVQGQLGKGNFGSVFQAILVNVSALADRGSRVASGCLSSLSLFLSLPLTALAGARAGRRHRRHVRRADKEEPRGCEKGGQVEAGPTARMQQAAWGWSTGRAGRMTGKRRR